MTRLASALLCLVACSPTPAPKLTQDSWFGVQPGMSRHALAKHFAPRGSGKWYELEAVSGEARVRWAADAADGAPQAVDVSIGTDGKVRELVFTMRPDDARAQLSALGGAAPSGVTKYQSPATDVVVAPGLGQWTVRLTARDVGR